jgi:sigma-E factor negative regulatory protein RseC
MFLAEEGIVVRLDAGNTVWVEATRTGACEGCSSRGACHAGTVNTMEAHALNVAGAGVGDRVLMEVSHRSIVKVSLLLYIFPVLALAMGAFTGKYLAETFALDAQAAPALLGFVFFLVSIIVVVISGRVAGRNKQYLPKVTRIL